MTHAHSAADAVWDFGLLSQQPIDPGMVSAPRRWKPLLFVSVGIGIAFAVVRAWPSLVVSFAVLFGLVFYLAFLTIWFRLDPSSTPAPPGDEPKDRPSASFAARSAFRQVLIVAGAMGLLTLFAFFATR